MIRRIQTRSSSNGEMVRLLRRMEDILKRMDKMEEIIKSTKDIMLKRMIASAEETQEKEKKSEGSLAPSMPSSFSLRGFSTGVSRDVKTKTDSPPTGSNSSLQTEEMTFKTVADRLLVLESSFVKLSSKVEEKFNWVDEKFNRVEDKIEREKLNTSLVANVAEKLQASSGEKRNRDPLILALDVLKTIGTAVGALCLVIQTFM